MYGPPRSKYFEIFGPPLKFLDRVHIAPVVHMSNCTKNGRPRFVRSWDVLCSPGVMNQAYKLRLSLPELASPEARGLGEIYYI